MAGCVLFSQKPIYLRYVSKIAIFVPETHFCQGYRMGKASKSAFGLPVGSLEMFIESLPRPAKCTKNNVIFSNRYIHIPRTSKYPEKLLKLWKLCGKLPFFCGDLEGVGYICVSAWKKIYPWRHSNCWLPNSFTLGGGEAFKVLKCWQNAIFQFCRSKKKRNIFSNQWQLQAFQLAAHLGDKTKVMGILY